MQKIFLLFIGLVTGQLLFAQTEDSLQKVAMKQAQAGDFDASYRTLNAALKQKPNDLALLKDQAYICYLKRDFVTGLTVSQALVQRPDADEQCYQIMGNIYKELAEFKEGAKMYRSALQKFPASGVLYSEYGDLLMQDHDMKDAISTWEKGIQVDVNNNSNYYYASKYYFATNNLLWGLLYGEIFVNIESYTQRTTEIKDLLYAGYKKLFTGNTLQSTNSGSKGIAKAISDVLVKDASPISGDTILAISAIRTKFIVDWVNSGQAKVYPFRLFDLHRQLIESKAFDAYNVWLFGASADEKKYNAWQKQNAAQVDQWQQLLHNVVFKIPAGQYYTD